MSRVLWQFTCTCTAGMNLQVWNSNATVLCLQAAIDGTLDAVVPAKIP